MSVPFQLDSQIIHIPDVQDPPLPLPDRYPAVDIGSAAVNFLRR